jgi:hypothetical protein
MRDKIFKILGPIDLDQALNQFMPIIEMMREKDIDQWGLFGREKNGVIDYGEGKTEKNSKPNYAEWNVWRNPELNTGWFKEFLESLAPRQVGRTRIMRMTGRKCYSWHRDLGPRIHVPLITTNDNFMIVGPLAHHLTIGLAWWVDTTKWHSAMNCSEIDRFHIVMEVSK